MEKYMKGTMTISCRFFVKMAYNYSDLSGKRLLYMDWFTLWQKFNETRYRIYLERHA